MKKILSITSVLLILMSLVCVPTFAKEYSYNDVYTVDIPDELEYSSVLANAEGYDDVKAWTTAADNETFLTAFIFSQNTNLGIDFKKASDDELDDFIQHCITDIISDDFKCDIDYQKALHKKNDILKISLRNIETPNSPDLNGDIYIFSAKEKTCMVYFLSLEPGVLNGEIVAQVMDGFEFKVNFFEEYSTYIYIGIAVIVLLLLLSIIKSTSKKKQQITITQYEMPANFKSYTDDGSAPVSFDDFAQTDYASDMKAQFAQYSQPKNNDDGLGNLSASNMDNSLLYKKEETNNSEYKDSDSLSVSNLDSSLLAKKEETNYSEYKDSDSLSVSNLDTSLLSKKEEEKSSWLD